jgi:prolyl 4-hydroxylase
MNAGVAFQAVELLRAGRFEAAMDVLGQAARRGDAEALEMLADMALSGEIVERDLPLSRDFYARAAQAGSASAAAAYRAFVANGTGGAANWLEALRLLDEAAPHDPRAAADRAIIAAMPLGENGEPTGSFEFETFSTSPDVRLFRGLFTAAECDFLVERSLHSLQPSLVIDPDTGQQVPNPVRTSHATMYPLVFESPAIHALCRRLAAASGTHVNDGEPLQVLRYSAGQEYRAHLDAIADEPNQRVLTFLIYLNDDYEGGETNFLASGLRVKGAKGDGLLFRNASKSGSPDPASRHAGLPVVKGEKFLASRWIRQRPMVAR